MRRWLKIQARRDQVWLRRHLESCGAIYAKRRNGTYESFGFATAGDIAGIVFSTEEQFFASAAHGDWPE